MSKRPSVDRSDQSPSTPELAAGNFQPPSMRRLVAMVYEFGLLLIITLTVICVSPLAVDPALKLQPLSLLGMVIPTDFLMLPAVHAILQILTLIAIGLWVLKKATRWIYVATPILFIAFMSTVVESHYFIHHQSHFAAMALVLLGAARFSGSKPTKDLATNDSNTNQSAPVDPLPGWCFMLLVYYIGISYTFSGISKLYYSGWAWGDGSSLMMWVEAKASGRDNLLFELLTNHHWLASTLQTTTLITELFAILFLFIPRLRPIFGLVFVGFHLSIEILFGFSFIPNIFLDAYILIVCFMVPEYRINGLQFFSELLSRGPTSLFSGTGEAELQATN